jgi:hypothetical protein
MVTRRFDALSATVVSATGLSAVTISATTYLNIEAGTTIRELVFCVPGTLAIGDQAPWLHTPFAGTVNSMVGSVKTPSTVGAVSVDILKCLSTQMCATAATWTTILSTTITIDQDELSTRTAATAAALSGTQTFAINDYFRINIDGAGVGAADLTIGMKVGM